MTPEEVMLNCYGKYEIQDIFGMCGMSADTATADMSTKEQVIKSVLRNYTNEEIVSRIVNYEIKKAEK
jgi:hypothetical protein